jgi:hypothetical protein
MKLVMKLIWVRALSLLILSTPSFAAMRPSVGPELTAFRVSLLAAPDSAFGGFGSAKVAWVPAFLLGSGLNAKAVLGFSLYKDPAGSRFGAIDSQVLIDWNVISSFRVEGGGGAETWVGNGGVFGKLTVNAAYEPDFPWFDFLDRVYVGYSRVMGSASAHLIELGVQLIF